MVPEARFRADMRLVGSTGGVLNSYRIPRLIVRCWLSFQSSCTKAFTDVVLCVCGLLDCDCTANVGYPNSRSLIPEPDIAPANEMEPRESRSRIPFCWIFRTSPPILIPCAPRTVDQVSLIWYVFAARSIGISVTSPTCENPLTLKDGYPKSRARLGR